MIDGEKNGQERESERDTFMIVAPHPLAWNGTWPKSLQAETRAANHDTSRCESCVGCACAFLPYLMCLAISLSRV